MKTTAKYILSLRRLAIEVFEPNSNHHAITKELLSDFNVTEIQINDLLNKYNNYNASDLENLSINCNLVIDVMDFTKFKIAFPREGGFGNEVYPDHASAAHNSRT